MLQAKPLAVKLEALGATTVVHPTISIVAPDNFTVLDTALRQLSEFDWIVFTSTNAVHAVLDRCNAIELAVHQLNTRKIAAVGTTTAQALAAHNIKATVVPKSFIAYSLIDALDTHVVGKRVLLPRGDLAKDDIPFELRKRGAIVVEAISYRTVPGLGVPSLLADLHSGALTAITFASSSAVQYFVNGAMHNKEYGREWLSGLWERAQRPAVFCIGPITSATARELEVPVDAVAAEHDADGLVQAITDWFAARSSSLGTS